MSRSRRSRPDRGRQDHKDFVWRRIDLHIHTPASADYQEPSTSFLDILRKAEARGADLIAFTDHNSVRGYANLWREIEDLELLEALERLAPAEQRRLEDYRRLLTRIRLLPGFELTATFGFHILAIFPEGTPIRVLEHILLQLNVPEDKIDLGTGEVGATTDVLTAYEALHEAGALVIPAHVNSTHGVWMQNLPFGGQTKIAFTQSQFIDALEATDLESTSRRTTAKFFNGSKPEYPRRMHVIQGSDAHRLHRDPQRESNLGVCERMTEVLMPDGPLTFQMLAQLVRGNDFNRVRPFRPSQDPFDFVRTARSEGETIVQAFHERPPVRRGRLSPIVRDIAALANVNGGTVFIGLSANPKDAVVGVEKAVEQIEVIREDIARHIVPPLPATIELSTTADKQVIVVTVPAGSEKPYAVAPGTIYVRQEGDTSIALRDEIVQLVKAGLEISASGLPELVPVAAPTSAPAPPAPVPAASQTPVAATADPTATPAAARRPRRRRRAQPGEDTDTTPRVAADDVSIAVLQPPATNPPLDSADAEVADPAIPYPRTGVEIVASNERDGVAYHAMRDLRNLKVVHNVTRDSARRLWRYAITQHEQGACKPEQVNWQGERGFWKAYKPRGGERRYNLCYSQNGTMHVFYGVTDEGMDEHWRVLVPPAPAPVDTANGGSASESDSASTETSEGVSNGTVN